MFSPAYYHTGGTSGHAVKCHIILAVLCLSFLQTSLLFLSIHKTFVEIITCSGLFQLGISISAYVFGKV